MAELRIHDQSSIYFKSIRTGHTPKDINVKTPDRSGTLITDTTLRDILNSGANISNTQILKPDIRETPLEHPEAYAKLLPIATYRTNDTFVGEHQATEWVASLNEDFSTILDSTGDPIYRDGWYPAIDTASTKIYVKYRFISNDVASPYSDSLEFTTPEGFVAIPSLSVIEDGATPLLKGSPFKLVGNLTGVNHTASSWSIIRESDNKVIKTLTMDTTKLTEWKVETGLLEPNTAYKVTLVYHTDHPVFSKTRMAIGTYKTPASAIETPTLTFSSADGKFVVNGTPFNVISGTDEHVFTSWIVRNSTSALVFSEPKSKELTSINLTGVLEPDNGYTIECTYKGSKSTSNTARLEFRTPSNANINLTKEITLKMLDNGDLELTMAPFTQPVQENMLYLTWTLQDFNKKQAVEVRLDKDLDDKYGKELKYTIPASSVKRYLGAATTVDEDGSKYIEFSAKGRVVGEKSIANYSTILPLKVKLTIEKVGNWEVVDSTDMRVPELKAPLAAVNGTNYANRTTAIESSFSYGTYWTKSESDMSRLKQASLSTFNILDNDAYAIWDIYQGYNNSGKVVYGQEPSFRYVYSGLRPDGTNSRIDTFKLPARLEDNTEYKVKVTYVYKDFGVYSIPETFTFNTSDIYYKVTSLNVDTSGEKPVVTIERNNNQAGMTFGNTSWYLYEQNGTKVWSSENNSTNTTSITIDYGSFDPDKKYRVGCIVYGPDGVKHSPERQSDLFNIEVRLEATIYVNKELERKATFGTNYVYGFKFTKEVNGKMVPIDDVSKYIKSLTVTNFRAGDSVGYTYAPLNTQYLHEYTTYFTTRLSITENYRATYLATIHGSMWGETGYGNEKKISFYASDNRISFDNARLKKFGFSDTIWGVYSKEGSRDVAGDNGYGRIYPNFCSPTDITITTSIVPADGVTLMVLDNNQKKPYATLDTGNGVGFTTNAGLVEMYPIRHFSSYRRDIAIFTNRVGNLKYFYPTNEEDTHVFSILEYLESNEKLPDDSVTKGKSERYRTFDYTGPSQKLTEKQELNYDPTKYHTIFMGVDKNKNSIRTNFDYLVDFELDANRPNYRHKYVNWFKSKKVTPYLVINPDGANKYGVMSDSLNAIFHSNNTIYAYHYTDELKLKTSNDMELEYEATDMVKWIYGWNVTKDTMPNYPFDPETQLQNILGNITLGEPLRNGVFLYNNKYKTTNVGVMYGPESTNTQLPNLLKSIVVDILSPGQGSTSSMKMRLAVKMLIRGIPMSYCGSVYSILSLADLRDYITISQEMLDRNILDYQTSKDLKRDQPKDITVNCIGKVMYQPQASNNIDPNGERKAKLGISRLRLASETDNRSSKIYYGNTRRPLMECTYNIPRGFSIDGTYNNEVSDTVTHPTYSNYQRVYETIIGGLTNGAPYGTDIVMVKNETFLPSKYTLYTSLIANTDAVLGDDILNYTGTETSAAGKVNYDKSSELYASECNMYTTDEIGYINNNNNPEVIVGDIQAMSAYVNTVPDKGFFANGVLPELLKAGITTGYNTIDKWHIMIWRGFILVLPNKRLFTSSTPSIEAYVNRIKSGESILKDNYTFTQPDTSGKTNTIKYLKPIFLLDHRDGCPGETMLDLVRRARFIDDEYQAFGDELGLRLSKDDARSLYSEIVNTDNGRLKLSSTSYLGFDYLDWNDSTAPQGYYVAFLCLPEKPYVDGFNNTDLTEVSATPPASTERQPILLKRYVVDAL